MPLFTPIIQDETLATFTKMLDKNDRWVNPQSQTATEIWNYWRALLAFPGTIFQDEIWEEVKIVQCQLNPDFLTLPALEKLTNNSVNSKPSPISNFEDNFESLKLTKNNPENISNSFAKISDLVVKNQWLQVKIGKQTLTFLQCQNQTLLQIKAIQLTSGQKIDLAGFKLK